MVAASARAVEPGEGVGRSGAPHPAGGWLVRSALVTSVLALVAVAVAGWAGSPPATGVRGVLLLLFWLSGPGGALLPRLPLRASTQVALTPLTGLALLLTVSTVGAWTGWWIPDAATAAVAVASAVGAGTLARSRPRPRPRWVRPARSTVVLLGGLAVGLALWAVALTSAMEVTDAPYGLLVGGPPTLAAGLAVTLVVLVAALRLQRTGVVAACAGALVLQLRASASVVDPVPVAVWTYKHLGVVATLQEHHHVLGGSDIYMRWPAMFSAAAWFSDSSGVPPIDLARWMPPLVHVLIALAVFAAARALGADALGGAAASFLAVAFNWVGQDYFSPQAVAFCLAAGILALWVQARGSRTCTVLSLALFAVVVPTHQLTPFWLLGVAVLLTVLRRLSWLVPLVMVVLLAAYVVPRLGAVESYGLFSGFDPVGNAASNVTTSTGAGQQMGSLVTRTATALVWGAALVVLLARQWRLGWRRVFRSPEVLVPAVLAFSPVFILGGQNYGGEAILRVVLYSTVGCSVVLGPALARGVRRGTVRTALACVWLATAFALVCQASYQSWSINLVQPEDVAAARWLAAEHPDARVLALTENWPGLIAFQYERFAGQDTMPVTSLDGALKPAPPAVAVTPLAPTIADLDRVVQAGDGSPTFVVATDSTRAWDEYYAIYRPGVYDRLVQDVAASSSWELVRSDGSARIWQYVGG